MKRFAMAAIVVGAAMQAGCRHWCEQPPPAYYCQPCPAVCAPGCAPATSCAPACASPCTPAASPYNLQPNTTYTPPGSTYSRGPVTGTTTGPSSGFSNGAAGGAYNTTPNAATVPPALGPGAGR
jgi:hypothetical protein